MKPRRHGGLILGTWLVGLGLVFLVRETMDWSWGEAWPMFVILAGIASGVDVLSRGLRGIAGLWRLTWPVAWIVVGGFLLASTTGRLGIGPGELLDTWWPWALVVLGAWFLIGAIVPGGHKMETLVLPLAGAQRAQVRISFGAGVLATHRAAAGNLVDGSFAGGVHHRLDGAGRVELSQDLDGGLPWLDRDSRWDVGLTAEVPLDLRLDTGANRGTIDLSDLRVATLEVHTGASETHIRLPRAAGSTSVRAESGAASLVFEVPPGVGARIRSRMALGSSQVDQTRFPKIGDVYQSVDYGTAPNRVDIDVQGGVGSVKVVSASA